MNTYRIVLDDDGVGLDKRIEFEAEDAAQALMVLEREGRGRRAKVWENEAPLCSLVRLREGFWTINT